MEATNPQDRTIDHVEMAASKNGRSRHRPDIIFDGQRSYLENRNHLNAFYSFPIHVHVAMISTWVINLSEACLSAHGLDSSVSLSLVHFSHCQQRSSPSFLASHTSICQHNTCKCRGDTHGPRPHVR